MKLGAILLLAIVLNGCALTGPALRDVGIVEYGRFERKKSSATSNDEQAPTKRGDVVADARLIELTTEIPAVLGTSFGLRVKFIGEPIGATISCTAKCIHPKITDPASGRTTETEQWRNTGTIGSDGYIGYSFDNPSELVPGDWTIQIFTGSKLRAQKTFTVKPAS